MCAGRIETNRDRDWRSDNVLSNLFLRLRTESRAKRKKKEKKLKRKRRKKNGFGPPRLHNSGSRLAFRIQTDNSLQLVHRRRRIQIQSCHLSLSFSLRLWLLNKQNAGLVFISCRPCFFSDFVWQRSTAKRLTGLFFLCVRVSLFVFTILFYSFSLTGVCFFFQKYSDGLASNYAALMSFFIGPLRHVIHQLRLFFLLCCLGLVSRTVNEWLVSQRLVRCWAGDSCSFPRSLRSSDNAFPEGFQDDERENRERERERERDSPRRRPDSLRHPKWPKCSFRNLRQRTNKRGRTGPDKHRPETSMDTFVLQEPTSPFFVLFHLVSLLFLAPNELHSRSPFTFVNWLGWRGSTGLF